MRAAFNIGAFGVVALLAGCGNNSSINAPAPALTGSQDDSGDAGPVSNCVSQESCPDALPDVGANFDSAGGFAGVVGQASEWIMHGVDRNTMNQDGVSSAREVMVLIADLPPGAVLTGDPSKLAETTSIYWTPAAATNGTLQVALRDYDRCVINQSASACNQRVPLPDYDTLEQPIPYVIEAAGAATGAAPSTAAATSTATATSLRLR